jgi:hypothetical protein
MFEDVAPYKDECDHVFLMITSAPWNFKMDWNKYRTKIGQ